MRRLGAKLTVRESLEAVTPDADAVARWLHRILDEHSIEIDDVVYPPSLAWLVQAVRKRP